MMNKTTNGRSALLALLLLCLSIFVLAVPKAADASGIGNARVIDEMHLLSDAEVQKLDASLAAVERKHPGDQVPHRNLSICAHKKTTRKGWFFRA